MRRGSAGVRRPGWGWRLGPPAAPARTRKTVTLVGGVPSEGNGWCPTDPVAACGTQNATTAARGDRPLRYVAKTDDIDVKRSMAQRLRVTTHNRPCTVRPHPPWPWSNGPPVPSADGRRDAISRAAHGPNAPGTDGFAGVERMPALWKSVTPPNLRGSSQRTRRPGCAT